MSGYFNFITVAEPTEEGIIKATQLLHERLQKIKADRIAREHANNVSKANDPIYNIMARPRL
jgi:hypothetical protein